MSAEAPQSAILKFVNDTAKQKELDGSYFCGSFADGREEPLRQLDTTATDVTSLNLNNVLVRAAYIGDVHVVKACLLKGAQVNNQDESGRAVLHAAAAGGHVEVLRCLLQQASISIDLRDHKGWTPLLIAVCKDRVAAAEVLLAHGADPNIEIAHNSAPCRETPTHSSAIHFAAMRCNIEMFQLLLNQGVPADKRDAANRVPLHYAVCRNSLEFVTSLIALAPSAVTALDCHQRTPLHAAAMSGSTEGVLLLLRHGANPTVKDKWDADPITLALLHKHPQTAAAFPFDNENHPPCFHLSSLEQRIVSVLSTGLQEQNREQLERCVKRLGCETCLTLLDDTLKIQDNGGQFTQDGNRKRTAGGVFFHLIQAGVAEGRYSIEDWKYITMVSRERARAARRARVTSPLGHNNKTNSKL